MANTYGGGSDPFGLANDDFDFVSAGPSLSKDQAVAKGSDGEFLPDSRKTFNSKTEITAKYVANSVGAVTPPDVMIGAEAGGYVITGAKLSGQNTAHCTLEVTGHKHTGGTGTTHVANSHTIVWPTVTGFGAWDPFGTSGLTATELQSCSYDVQMGHVDAQDSGGNFLAGRSQGIVVTAQAEAVSDQAITLADPTGWKLTTVSTPRNEEGFYGISITGTMHPGDTWKNEA